MAELAEYIRLPDTMSNWPWPREINPHYESIMVESDEWIHSFKAFSERSQYAFDKCNFQLLSSLVYPRVSKELLLVGCNMMSFLFAIDEYTDVASVWVVQEMVDIILDAMHNPHKPRPQGEIILGEMARQFWELAIKIATPSSQRHFLSACTSYLNSVIQQAADREKHNIRSLDAYFENRREDVGTRPTFALLEFELDLPDEVIYHPIIVELTTRATDMIILCNDFASYNREQASGNAHQNIITVLIHHMNMDIDGTMKWITDYHRETERKFLSAFKRVPSWGEETDHQVKKYLNGLANWVRGNDCWSFEGGRYFGSRGLEYQKTRLVPLLSRTGSAEDGPPTSGENMVVYLVDDLYSE